jgi:glycosyltransferase involved in cell wall biosynthesis
MKILHCVEQYYPTLGGMQEVVKQLSERMAALGHDVTVATTATESRDFTVLNGVKVISFPITGRLAYGIEGDIESYREFLVNGDWEVITFFATQQWATDAAFGVMDKIKAVKVSVPTGYSGLYWPAYKDYFEKMKNWIHSYDMNVYLSDDYRDINFARENGVKKLVLIPNGAAADEFLAPNPIDVRNELGLKKENALVLHVGSFSGWKGQKAAMEIFLRSALKNATLLLIGNGAEGFKQSLRKSLKLRFRKFFASLFMNKKVIAGEFSRTFTVAAYKQADLFLFPSNIECSPIVLFECAASALPFLSTDAGNSVEIAKWTKGGKILPTRKTEDGFSFAEIDKSVEVLNTLWKNEAERKRMAEESFEIWKQKYTWEEITRSYLKLYEDLLGKKKQTAVK